MKVSQSSHLGTAALMAIAASLSTPVLAQDFRIVGGEPILIDRAPSIVAMLNANTLANSGSAYQAQFCAGTLIASNWVLTASHCLSSFGDVTPASDLKILVNSSDLNNPTENAIDVAEVIVHENYDDISSSSDIALLRLATPAQGAIAPLNLTPLEINETMQLAGWGARQHTPEEGSFDYPAQLHGVEVLALPAGDCNVLPAYAGQIDETMVCAGFPDGGKDACQGDSGGPMYRTDSSGSLIIAGITSWGQGCALEGRPGVYADVAHFNAWILDKIGTTTQPPVIVEPETEVPEVPEVPEVIEEPEGPIVTDNDPINIPLDVTTDENGNPISVGIPALSLNGGGGSAGGWLLIAMAAFGLARRRAVKA